MTQGNRNIFVFGIAMVFVGLALIFLLPRSHPGPDQTIVMPNDTDAPSETPEPALHSDPARAMTNEDAPLAFFKSINRYPGNNKRLTDRSHDLLNPGARHEQRRRIPANPDNPDPGWEVLFTADRYYINGEESAEITLQLWHEGQPVTPESLQLVARTVTAQGPTVTLREQRNGAGVSTVFRPNEAWPDFAGPVQVVARFSADGMAPQSGTLDFHFTGSEQNPGKFTGAVSERLTQGSLTFDVGVDIHIAGRFRIEANLFDAMGRPFGWARFDAPLEKGRQRVELTFDGLLFHDAQAQAPFLLTQLRGYRLSPEHASGRQTIPTIELNHATAGDYDLADFRDTVIISPRQARMMEMYQDAQRRGVQLTRPEYTGD
jgi:hypothetical protein